MNFLDYHAKKMENPAFRKEFEALEIEYAIKTAILEARKQRNMTQEQLAQATGIDRADISKLERGEGNPTVATLERLAEGMNMRFRIAFEHK